MSAIPTSRTVTVQFVLSQIEHHATLAVAIRFDGSESIPPFRANYIWPRTDGARARVLADIRHCLCDTAAADVEVFVTAVDSVHYFPVPAEPPMTLPALVVEDNIPGASQADLIASPPASSGADTLGDTSGEEEPAGIAAVRQRVIQALEGLSRPVKRLGLADAAGISPQSSYLTRALSSLRNDGTLSAEVPRGYHWLASRAIPDGFRG